MSALVLTGSGVVSAAGLGTTAMTEALAVGVPVLSDVTSMYAQPLPYETAHALPSFDVRALLGRKGTSFIDRATSLTLAACGQAIEDSGLVVDDASRDRIGIALGTTVGSLSSSSEYSRETLVAERPYLVNPVLFPNTVMNCAAGQAAIRYGLKGVNSTVAGGRLGFLGALRYAVNILRRGYADAMLVGAVEEFTPHTAWLHRKLGRRGLPGEAAAIFVLERRDTVAGQGRRALAELAAVTAGYLPGGGPCGLPGRLVACLINTLGRSGLAAGAVKSVAVTEATGDGDETTESAAAATIAAAAPYGSVQQVRIRDILGDCGAASGALQFGAMLTPGAPQYPPPGLQVGWSTEGAFSATVLKPAS